MHTKYSGGHDIFVKIIKNPGNGWQKCWRRKSKKKQTNFNIL